MSWGWDSLENILHRKWTCGHTTNAAACFGDKYNSSVKNEFVGNKQGVSDGRLWSLPTLFLLPPDMCILYCTYMCQCVSLSVFNRLWKSKSKQCFRKVLDRSSGKVENDSGIWERRSHQIDTRPDRDWEGVEILGPGRVDRKVQGEE